MGQSTSASDVRELFRSTNFSLRRAQGLSHNAAASTARFHSRTDGRSLEDDYSLDHRMVLGKGSGAKVVLARRCVNGRKYAVKTLGGGKQKRSRNDWAMLAAEVEIGLALDHPNIVRVHDVYQTQGEVMYLVMECCSGGDLFFRLSDRGVFSEEEAATAMRQMVRAVSHLHARHIAHRDLKPENFLYENSEPDALLKLTDFGFACFCDPSSLMHACCGSLGYVSPEILARNGYTNKCDMWSLGVIGFMLLVGRPPFAGKTHKELRHNVRTCDVDWDFTSRGTSKNSISEEARHFLQRLLTREPDERLSAREASFHPWLIRASDVKKAVHLSSMAVEPLMRYAGAPRLRRLVMQMIAQDLPSRDLRELSALFTALDKDNVGFLRACDLKDALSRAANRVKAPPLPNTLDEVLDTGWGELVSLTDFLAAMLGAMPGTCQEALRSTFHRLDVDGSGSISAEDLRSALCFEFEGVPAEALLAEVSVNNGEELSFPDFAHLVGVNVVLEDPGSSMEGVVKEVLGSTGGTREGTELWAYDDNPPGETGAWPDADCSRAYDPFDLDRGGSFDDFGMERLLGDPVNLETFSRFLVLDAAVTRHGDCTALFTA